MPAAKINYLVLYENDPQVYGCSSRDIALSSPPPEGYSLEEKRIYFVTIEPDNGRLVWRRLPQWEIENAEIKYPKKKVKEDEQDPPQSYTS